MDKKRWCESLVSLSRFNAAHATSAANATQADKRIESPDDMVDNVMKN